MNILFYFIFAVCYIIGFFIFVGILTFLVSRGMIFENYKDHNDDYLNFWMSCIFWPLASILFIIIGLINIAIKITFKYQNLIIKFSGKKNSEIDEAKSDYRNISIK